MGRSATSTPRSLTSTCGHLPSSITERWPTFPYTTHAAFTTDEMAGSHTFCGVHFAACCLGTSVSWGEAKHICAIYTVCSDRLLSVCNGNRWKGIALLSDYSQLKCLQCLVEDNLINLCLQRTPWEYIIQQAVELVNSHS